MYGAIMNIEVIIMIVIGILFIIILLYLYLIAPGKSRKESFKPYEDVYIAHRGLFNNKDVPENSLTAFRKAVENNYGIELDVQLTTDDQLVVFHDQSLKRMTGIDKDLIDCDFRELETYRLLDTDEKIPLFSDVLKVLNKDTPLVVEIKPEGRYIETTKRTVEMLKSYDGLYNMESFNPLVVRYLRKNNPEIVRGQLAYDSLKDPDNKTNILIRFITTYLLMNFLARPDYVAYDCNSTDNPSFRLCSKLFKTECVAWTIKSQKQLEENRKYYQCFIFDSFMPEEKR